MTDIKDLLSKAIGDDEPPIGIDRDEVFRVGRLRVRRRRALAAGGVVAAVVVAVVGATVLTDFVENRPDDVPVATAPPAPPGPELPLPPSTTVRVPSPLTDEHADKLTQQLYNSGVVDLKSAMPWPGQGPPVRFRVENGELVYEADVTAQGREGQLRVTVAMASSKLGPSCDRYTDKYDTCTVSKTYDPPVLQATRKSARGERRILAVTVLANGAKVEATATNLLRRDEDHGKSPDDDATVLAMDELSTLVTKLGRGV